MENQMKYEVWYNGVDNRFMARMLVGSEEVGPICSGDTSTDAVFLLGIAYGKNPENFEPEKS
jgi:hypothetical protein